LGGSSLRAISDRNSRGAFRKIDVLNNLSLLLIELGFAGRSGDPRHPQLLTLWLDITEAVKFAQPILDVARFVLILAKRALELFHCEWLAGKHTSLNTVKHSL
jgi:hypothetical protein